MASYVLGLIYNVDFLDDAQVLFNFFLFEKKKKSKFCVLEKPEGGYFQPRITNLSSFEKLATQL